MSQRFPGNESGMKAKSKICDRTMSGDGDGDSTALASASMGTIKRTIFRGTSRRHGQPFGKRMGRPRGELVNDPELVKRAYYACAEFGCTLQQLSNILACSMARLGSWMRYDKSFHSAVRLGLDAFNSNKVERALLKRALGFTYDEVTEQDVEVFGKNSLGMSVKVPGHKTTVVHKTVAPDVAALVFYLTNRDGARWKQTFHQETNTTTETFHQHNVTVDWSKVPKEDLETLRNIVSRIEPKGNADPDPKAIGRRARQSVFA